jgi:hypothetical protein
MINILTFIVGDSGSGKSSTFRNLPADKTVIVNTERKPLPFRSFSKFKNINISKYKDFAKLMKELKTNDKYEYVVVDSITSLLEMANKYCESVYSGFNIWSEYNSIVYEILQSLKDLPQQTFVTGIPEYVEVKPGEPKAFIKTKGKEWKASLEKEATMVLHTDLVEDEEGNIVEFRLDTKPSKHTSAKSPDGIFEERYIPNDAMVVVEAIKKYYE